MSVLFALDASLCAAALAVLFILMWYDGQPVAVAALAVALLATLLLGIAAWREAL